MKENEWRRQFELAFSAFELERSITGGYYLSHSTEYAWKGWLLAMQTVEFQNQNKKEDQHV